MLGSLGRSLNKKGLCLCPAIYSEGPCRGIRSCLMRLLLLRELFEVCQVFPARLKWREGRTVFAEREGGREEEDEGRGAERRTVPWSVFPQVLCYLALKLEPCGNERVQVNSARCGSREVNWGDSVQRETRGPRRGNLAQGPLGPRWKWIIDFHRTTSLISSVHRLHHGFLFELTLVLR